MPLHLKESIASPDRIIKYLSSYINRIAISDKRIVDIKDDDVTFRYIDRKDGSLGKLLKIPVTTFISRFLLHAVPSGFVTSFFKRNVSGVGTLFLLERFVRIRYYRFLANRNRTNNLAWCRAAVTGNQEASVEDEDTVSEIELNILELTVTFPVCPHCRSTRLKLTKEIPKRQNETHVHVAYATSLLSDSHLKNRNQHFLLFFYYINFEIRRKSAGYSTHIKIGIAGAASFFILRSHSYNGGGNYILSATQLRVCSKRELFVCAADRILKVSGNFSTGRERSS